MNIFSDGGARGNPGPAACAFVIIDESGKVLHKESKYLGRTTNNQAEYQGAVQALTWLLGNGAGIQPINFYLDSELIVKQLTGLYKVKDPDLRKLFSEAKELEGKISPKISFHHVPRTKNKLADFLVNQELDNN